jgi:hypothetical protein
MAGQPKTHIHSIHVSHATGVDDSGKLAKVKKLTFHVGDHGPFEQTFQPPNDTTQHMISHMTAQQTEVQQLHAATENSV